MVRADDQLVVFSDDVTEALNAAEQEFGDDRLVACLAEVTEKGAEPLLQHVFSGVERFTTGAAQHDDVTAMVVAYHSPGGMTAACADRRAGSRMRFVRQNESAPSRRRRTREFAALTDEEVQVLEVIVRDAFDGFAWSR